MCVYMRVRASSVVCPSPFSFRPHSLFLSFLKWGTADAEMKVTLLTIQCRVKDFVFLGLDGIRIQLNMLCLLPGICMFCFILVSRLILRFRDFCAE